MSYMHIDNLYKAKEILEFKTVYAMEKIHGTSAHVAWKDGKVTFFSGGADHKAFSALFFPVALADKFTELDLPEVVIFGEAYGGKLQGMKATYGPELRFVAFEVKIGTSWLSVPQAEDVVKKLGLEFVHYDLIETTQIALDRFRDADSVQAIRNGTGGGHKREGIVLRPPFEVRMNNGARIIAKYKREDFQETKTPRPLNVDKLAVLEKAQAIAEEWVTEMRLAHVLDAFPGAGIEQTGEVIKAMTADVEREAKGEIIASREARVAIGKRTASMFKARLQAGTFAGGAEAEL